MLGGPVSAAFVDVLAQTGSGTDGAGYLAFAVVAVLGLACWVLYRSLNRHLGRIDVDPPTRPAVRPDPDGPAAARPDAEPE